MFYKTFLGLQKNMSIQVTSLIFRNFINKSLIILKYTTKNNFTHNQNLHAEFYIKRFKVITPNQVFKQTRQIKEFIRGCQFLYIDLRKIHYCNF